MYEKDLQKLLDSGLRYIEDSESTFGEAYREQSSLVSAQIAQAKFLAVIAQALTELAKYAKNDYQNRP